MRKPLIAMLVVALFVLLVLASYFAVYAYSVSKVTVAGFDVLGVDKITSDGAEVSGILTLKNEGLITVSIKQIEYSVSLEHNGLELAKGSVTGGEIPAGKTAEYPLKVSLNWQPTPELALRLIGDQKTNAKITGTAYVSNPINKDVKINFEQTIDLNEYLQKFIQTQVNEQLSGLPPELIDQAAQILGTLAKLI